jgi:hypothetical protein
MGTKKSGPHVLQTLGRFLPITLSTAPRNGCPVSLERLCMDTSSLADCSMQLQSASGPNRGIWGEISQENVRFSPQENRWSRWCAPLTSARKRNEPLFDPYIDSEDLGRTWLSLDKAVHSLAANGNQKYHKRGRERVDDYRKHGSLMTVLKGLREL